MGDKSVLQEYFDQALPNLISFGIRVALALIIFLIGIKVIGFIRKRVRIYMSRANFENHIVHFTDLMIKVALYTVLILLILSDFGITASAVAALFASSGLTVGLGFQGALQNLAGGFIILVNKPFVPGDYIKEDSHGNEGVVSGITMLYTTLNTVDGRKVVLPNGPLANTSLVNYTREEKRCVNVSFGIEYSSDLKKAKSIMEEEARKSEYILSDEPVKVFVSELEDSSVSMGLHFYIKGVDYWPAKWDILERVKLAFDENGIVIAFPQLKVSH